MKQLFTLAMIGLALTWVMSCSKTKNNSTDYFTFQGANYPISATSRDTSRFTITFADPTTSETGSITCGFDTFSHITNGQYKVVKGLTTTTPGQMTLQLTIGLNTYYATGNDNVNATVTVSGGKFNITIPSVWVAAVPGDTLGPLPVDSAKVSGNINE